RYAVSVRQGGIGLNRDYYITPRLAEKKGAYLAYMAQLLAMIGWEAPEQSATAILDFETAIAELSWSNAERRDPEKTYNPMSVAASARPRRFRGAGCSQAPTSAASTASWWLKTPRFRRSLPCMRVRPWTRSRPGRPSTSPMPPHRTFRSVLSTQASTSTAKS